MKGAIPMDSLENKTIAVLMGGLSKEREVSMTTGTEVLNALLRQGLKAVKVEVGRDVAARLAELKPDIAFIALHGTFGEDGAIQGLLECMRIPYTGSGVLGSTLAYNKVATKRILTVEGIPTPRYAVFYKGRFDGAPCPLPLPVVVKPSDQGSSIGVSVVRKESEWKPALNMAFEISEEALVEEFIDGKLLAIGMNEDNPMPIVHIRPKSGFYDYEAKYTSGKTEYECPAQLTAKQVEACNRVARKVYRVLRGRGFPRVDVILSTEGTPYVLEMNTIPGMTPLSLLPMAAKQSGLEFDALVREITRSARLDIPEESTA
ncbi:MAG: D-alanine--D-alanine ligase [Nitrospina sp.]|nr:D-alanine--D-alanine ligase [Nitrospina sp.]